MAWTIEYDPRAIDDLKRLDRPVRQGIVRFLEERVARAGNPRQFGHAPRHDLSGLWRYRVGDHRIICQLGDSTLTVLVIGIGHRASVYR